MHHADRRPGRLRRRLRLARGSQRGDGRRRRDRAAYASAGRVVSDELYAHSVPVCWRCKSHVLFRLVYEWFISVDDVREPMLAAAQTVEWEPPHIGSRMDDWLHNMGDWCISRKRYWGLPLPFYRCDDCNELTVVGSRAELRERALDPAAGRRAARAAPAVDRRHQDHAARRAARRQRAFPEVGDCWLDAGITPFSTLGYFDDPEGWKQRFPAEWISEMREQVRLWYYSMLFMSVVLEGRAPVRAGAVVRAGDLRDRREVLEDGPHDPLRRRRAGDRRRPDPLPLLPATAGHRVPLRLRGGRAVATPHRRAVEHRVVLPHVRGHRPRRAWSSRRRSATALHVTDRWLLARTAQLVDVATAAMRREDTATTVREAEQFIEEVSNWYVRVNRRRFWRGGDDRRQAGVSLDAVRRLARGHARARPHRAVRHRGTVAAGRPALRGRRGRVGAPRALARRAGRVARRRAARGDAHRSHRHQHLTAPARGGEAPRAAAASGAHDRRRRRGARRAAASSRRRSSPS